MNAYVRTPRGKGSLHHLSPLDALVLLENTLVDVTIGPARQWATRVIAEAFSALCLRFRRDLDAGPERMNPHGGTIAMGHAFGATGAILVGQCVDELERRDGRYGVAVLVERVRA